MKKYVVSYQPGIGKRIVSKTLLWGKMRLFDLYYPMGNRLIY